MAPRSTTMKAIFWTVRLLAILVVAAALLGWIAEHHHGAIKGGAIPLPNVFYGLAFAGIAAFLVKKYWIGFAVPFVAGVAGVAGAIGLGEQLGGPYGGILGILVGSLVLLIPFGDRQEDHGVAPKDSFGAGEVGKS